MSLVIHGVVLAVVVVAPLVFPDQLRLRNDLEPVYNITSLVAPLMLEPPKELLVKRPTPSPERLVAPPPRELALRDERPVAPPIVEERKESPRLPEPPKLEPVFEEASLAAPAPPKAPAPPRAIVTGVLSSDSGDAPKPGKPARDVQTGGFGDPNGARGEGRPDRPANIASLGSFDLPAGPGYGNGTGGSRGARGAVASAGFGNGIASGIGYAPSRGRRCAARWFRRRTPRPNRHRWTGAFNHPKRNSGRNSFQAQTGLHRKCPEGACRRRSFPASAFCRKRHYSRS
jgi:hypothetical protein